MKLILDTNTVLSAVFKPENKQAELIALWRQGGFDWVTCTEQLQEISDVLSRFKIIQRIVGGSATAQAIVAQMYASCVMQPLTPPFPSVCREAKDDYLLAMLQHAKANFLITGDNNLLVLSPIFPILTTTQFLDRL
jgi:uncharacterized protein